MVNWIKDRSKMVTFLVQPKENWTELKISNVVKHFWRPVQPCKNILKICLPIITITINRPHLHRPLLIGCLVQVQPIKIRNHILHSKFNYFKMVNLHSFRGESWNYFFTNLVFLCYYISRHYIDQKIIKIHIFVQTI